MQLHVIDLELTFAGLHAIGPPVIDIFAANSSTVLEPRTTRSAATESAGFPECSTPWTRYRTIDL